MRLLITSGGTKVPIDMVRDITNLSHGTFGSLIAHVALEAGYDVTFLCAKRSRTPFSETFDFYRDPDDPQPKGFADWGEALNKFSDLFNFCERHRKRYREVRFRNYDHYSAYLRGLVREQRPDAVILAAAVSDYGVANYVDGKRRSDDNRRIELEPLTKLIHLVKKWHPACVLTGFKLLVNSEYDELVQAAADSIQFNHCDLVVANDLQDIKNNNHKLLVVDEDGVTPYEKHDSPDDPLYLARQVIQRTEVAWNATKFSSALPEV
jgi:phosphopantothenate-cysteine ligase